MGKISRVAALGVALSLTGCGLFEPAPVEVNDYTGAPNCGADQFQGLLGAPEAALQTAQLPPATRILRADDVIPLDFSPDRLTIDIDELGRVSSVTCR